MLPDVAAEAGARDGTGLTALGHWLADPTRSQGRGVHRESHHSIPAGTLAGTDGDDIGGRDRGDAAELYVQEALETRIRFHVLPSRRRTSGCRVPSGPQREPTA